MRWDFLAVGNQHSNHCHPERSERREAAIAKSRDLQLFTSDLPNAGPSTAPSFRQRNDASAQDDDHEEEKLGAIS
jgi:hypothetical protein